MIKLGRNKKNIIYIVFLILVFGSVLYYFYPRNVVFSLYKEFDIGNNKEIPYYFVRNEKGLYMLLYKRYGYDSVFVTNIVKTLDIKNYDYIITFNKILLKLSYSPYYTDFKDGCPFFKKIPLIPKYYPKKTNKMYIYKIKKNNNFRDICG